jgi:hypothetical protein
MTGYHKNGQGWIGNTIEELTINPHANGCTNLEDDNWIMSMNRLQYKGRLSDNVILTSSVYYQHQTGSYRFDLDNYMRRMVDTSWETTNMLYDYGLTHNMVGANIISKFYLRHFTVNVGLNGYSYNRKHFSGDKSQNIPDNEVYNNVGYKNDFNSFAVIEYSPLNNLSFGGNIQYRYTNFYYKDNINPSYNFNTKDYNTWLKRDLIWCKIDNITFFNTHVGWDMGDESGMKQLDKIIDEIKRHEERYFIAGDFNYPDNSDEIKYFKKYVYSLSDLANVISSENPTFHFNLDNEWDLITV